MRKYLFLVFRGLKIWRFSGLRFSSFQYVTFLGVLVTALGAIGGLGPDRCATESAWPAVIARVLIEHFINWPRFSLISVVSIIPQNIWYLLALASFFLSGHSSCRSCSTSSGYYNLRHNTYSWCYCCYCYCKLISSCRRRCSISSGSFFTWFWRSPNFCSASLIAVWSASFISLMYPLLGKRELAILSYFGAAVCRRNLAKDLKVLFDVFYQSTSCINYNIIRISGLPSLHLQKPQILTKFWIQSTSLPVVNDPVGSVATALRPLTRVLLGTLTYLSLLECWHCLLLEICLGQMRLWICQANWFRNLWFLENTPVTHLCWEMSLTRLEKRGKFLVLQIVPEWHSWYDPGWSQH